MPISLVRVQRRELRQELGDKGTLLGIGSEQRGMRVDGRRMWGMGGKWQQSKIDLPGERVERVARKQTARGKCTCLISCLQFCSFDKDHILLSSLLLRATYFPFCGNCSIYMIFSPPWCVLSSLFAVRPGPMRFVCHSVPHRTTNIHFGPLGLPLVDTDRPP